MSNSFLINRFSSISQNINKNNNDKIDENEINSFKMNTKQIISNYKFNDNHYIFNSQISKKIITSDLNYFFNENLSDISKIDLNLIISILKIKFDSFDFYTEASKNTLIALNPCESNPHLYSKDVMRSYRNWSLSLLDEKFNRSFVKPHIFKYAAIAWQTLTCDGFVSNKKYVNQTILVSGESGSGKTESISFIMSYFAYVSNTSKSTTIESILLKTNPILEAFGNASTILNENSSRFGKYIQLYFNDSNLISANIMTYLLEKTRSINEFNGKITDKNCNFHIFYECMLGSNEFERNEWCLNKNLTDKYLTCINLNEAEYIFKWKILKQSFIELDIFHHFSDIIKLVSSISHLNCCSFLNESTKLDKESSGHLEQAAHLLGFNLDDLKNYFLIHELKINYGRKNETKQKLLNTSYLNRNNGKTSKTRESLLLLLNGEIQKKSTNFTILKKPCTVNEMKQRNNCLIKLIYTEIFKWLVNKINSCLNTSNTDKEKLGFIGLLDIYGFENLQNNCLEQLCINYANEKLQQCFIESFFKLTQQDYKNESIEWQPIMYEDNLPVLSLLEQTNDCIFNLINEQSILKRDFKVKSSNSGILISKINSKLNVKNVNNTLQNLFEITHYAGKVTYNAENLIFKNNDHIPDDLSSFLSKSTNTFLKNEILVNFFQKHNIIQTKFNKKKSFTVLTKFKKNLDNLIRELKTSEINYIRCVKPNQRMEPNYFDENLVAKQLEACGIVSILNMSQANYAYKYFYYEFLQKYFPILFLIRKKKITDEKKLYSFSDFRILLTNSKFKKDVKALTKFIVDSSIFLAKTQIKNRNVTDNNLFQMGVTKIFLKSNLLDLLNDLNKQSLNICACIIQNKWRSYINKVKFVKMKHASIKIQRWFRLISLKRYNLIEVEVNYYASSSMTSISMSLYASATNSITRLDENNLIFI